MTQPGRTVDENGNVFYKLNGKLHREDGPAVERVDGDKIWYLHGNRHRENGPAIERSLGTKIWYLNGELHREDGPAVEYADGTKMWYLNGERHRENGPAIEFANGTKEWYLNGKQVSEEAVTNLRKNRKPKPSSGSKASPRAQEVQNRSKNMGLLSKISQDVKNQATSAAVDAAATEAAYLVADTVRSTLGKHYPAGLVSKLPTGAKQVEALVLVGLLRFAAETFNIPGADKVASYSNNAFHGLLFEVIRPLITPLRKAVLNVRGLLPDLEVPDLNTIDPK